MKISLTFTLLCLCILLAVTIAWALDVPAHPAGRVNDRSGMFSPQMSSQLNQFLGNYAGKSGNQIVVATFPSLSGGSLNDFARSLAVKWELGQGSQDKWILVVVFKNDRLIKIEVGPGLKDRLNDAECSTIIQQVVGPRFKSQDYDNGIKDAILVMVNILEDNVSFRSIQHKQLPRPVRTLLVFLLLAAFVSLAAVYRQRIGRPFRIDAQGSGYGLIIKPEQSGTSTSGMSGGW